MFCERECNGSRSYKSIADNRPALWHRHSARLPQLTIQGRARRRRRRHCAPCFALLICTSRNQDDRRHPSRRPWRRYSRPPAGIGETADHQRRSDAMTLILLSRPISWARAWCLKVPPTAARRRDIITKQSRSNLAAHFRARFSGRTTANPGANNPTSQKAKPRSDRTKGEELKKASRRLRRPVRFNVKAFDCLSTMRSKRGQRRKPLPDA